MFPNPNHRTLIVWTTLLVATSGCDKSATQIAREAADRQAQQNTEMAQLNKEVASGSHQLVEADAKARQEIVGVHHDFQAERTRLDTSRSELESERREIAGQRRAESAFASVTTLLGGGLLVALLLSFCWLVIFSAQRDGTHADLHELLVKEILLDDPALTVESSRTQIPASKSVQDW